MVLSAACAEIDNMYVSGDELVLEVNGTQYSLFSRTANLETLAGLVKGESGLKLRLDLKETGGSSVDDDIKELRHLIGEENLKVK